MSAPRPDYSPQMLAFFLRARAAERRGCEGCSREIAARRERAAMVRLAKLTAVQVDLAWMGRLNRAGPRAALWAVLGHFPADAGIVLTDDGGQRHG